MADLATIAELALLRVRLEKLETTILTLFGPRLTGAAGAPANPAVGALWVDTNANQLRRWDGASWVNVA